MQTIQIVIDDDLLRATDAQARRTKINRSALIREALGSYLRQQALRLKEDRDRRGYERQPATERELIGWERVAVWPED